MPWWNPFSSSSTESSTSSSFESVDDDLDPYPAAGPPLGGYEPIESYETAPEPGLFAGFFGKTVARFYDWGRDTGEKVEEAFDQFTQTIETTLNWFDQRTDDVMEGLDAARDQTVEAIETFGDRSMDALLFAKNRAQTKWDYDVEALDNVYQVAEEHSRSLEEGMAALVESRTATMRSIWDIGVEFAQAAEETGDIVVDAAFASRGELSDELIDSTIARVDANLQSSEGGKLFSSALDAGVWLLNVKEGVEYTVESVREGGSESGGLRDTLIENEKRELGLRGPFGYTSDRAARLFEGLEIDAGVVLGRIDTAIGDAYQLQREYESWRVEGNGSVEASLLTMVGDDDVSSRYEIAANLKAGDLPDYSTRVKVLETYNPGRDPNAAVMFTGILNDEKKAEGNVADAQKFAQQQYDEFVPIDLVYNPTHSGLYDAAQVQFVNKLDLIDRTTRAGIDEIRRKLSDDERDPSKPLHVFAHSQGAAIASSVLEHLTTEERAKVKVTTLGGAAYHFPAGLHSLEAIVNNQDVVPALLGAGIPFLDESEIYADPDYNVRYIDFGEAGNWANSHNMNGYRETYALLVAESRWEAAVRRFFFEDSQP